MTLWQQTCMQVRTPHSRPWTTSSLKWPNITCSSPTSVPPPSGASWISKEEAQTTTECYSKKHIVPRQIWYQLPRRKQRRNRFLIWILWQVEELKSGVWNLLRWDGKRAITRTLGLFSTHLFLAYLTCLRSLCLSPLSHDSRLHCFLLLSISSSFLTSLKIAFFMENWHSNMIVNPMWQN